EAALQWQKNQPDDKAAVIIAAEKSVTYETVVKAMSALQKAGVQRVGLSVKQGG
ncbi:MAG: biopolymer transporter ExbD, partial [Giesbergeria sp.]|nr:biopolymer transporter ExbD [Giesbergeria sp.]